MKEGDMSDSVEGNSNNNSDHSKNSNNNASEASNSDQVVNKIQPARSLQPLEHIVGSTPSKDVQKCFVHIKPCYPFGIANVDEQMLVVTPDDDLSLYEDAVVSLTINYIHIYYISQTSFLTTRDTIGHHTFR